MDIIIATRFHHGGKFVEDTSGGGLTYIGESEVEYVGIDKDHFSLMELLFYTRDMGYVTVGGFYFKDPTTNNFVLVDNDFSLLNLIKDLGDGDFLDLYVEHVVDEVEIIKDGVPTGYLCGPTVGEIINEDGVENSHNIKVDEGLQQEATQSENINVEVGVDDASDLEGVETDWDISDDSQEFAIPMMMTREIDEELRTLRNERRTKLREEKHDSLEEIILGVAGVDRGFKDIGRNKAARYVGRLGGDEKYIDSSELDNDYSRDELDPEAMEGVDLPARRKSKKARFDPDCVVAIFELGMVFENAIEFRKAVAEYVVDYKVKLKLRPNEKHRVRAKLMILKEFMGDWKMELARLCDYADMIKLTNPDLNLGTGHGLTVMSDMQKGLVAAIMELLPDCQDPEDHVVHWYRKDTFMKAYNYFNQPIPNMKMWPHTSDIVIEPSEPKQMPGRPPKCKRKSKDEPRKKYGKLSRRVGQPRSSTQPASSRQPTGYSQPPSSSSSTSWKRQGKRQGRGGDDASTVTRGQQAGRGRGREGASTSTRGNKRPKTVGFGIYTDDISGRQTLNPGTTGERVVTPAVFKCAPPTNIDIGYKPRGLKWKGKDAVTTPQLQRMSKSKRGGSANV
ncbi:hypothetical protein H5410_034793 [Solanum commersonii]|uniref:PB1-like domain-containing protein n=1 Tax=Solanum commersonii TaxID=4109 RepID=A0A9J5YUE5_SOLCO|nr:hypothetical protein H5410_034793 [Solanum commersonii]